MKISKKNIWNYKNLDVTSKIFWPHFESLVVRVSTSGKGHLRKRRVFGLPWETSVCRNIKVWGISINVSDTLAPQNTSPQHTLVPPHTRFSVGILYSRTKYLCTFKVPDWTLLNNSKTILNYPGLTMKNLIVFLFLFSIAVM